MKKLLQKDNVGKPIYAAALKTDSQARQTTKATLPSSEPTPTQQQRLRVEDDKCSVTINTFRFRGEKADLLQVKAVLQKNPNFQVCHFWQTTGEMEDPDLIVILRTSGHRDLARRAFRLPHNRPRYVEPTELPQYQ